MREQMRQHDRMFANVEAHPEGFNALARAYTDVQAPIMNAMASGRDDGVGNTVGGAQADNPFAALFGANENGNAAPGATAAAAAAAPGPEGSPNTSPLPNPWAPNAGSGAGSTSAPAPAGLPGLGGAPMGMGGMGMPGAGGMGGQSGGGGGGGSTGIAFSSQANVPPADRKSQ